MKTLRDLGEFGLIERLRRQLGRPGTSVAHGIGDDCAVLKPSGSRYLLCTCDPVIEGTHYLPATPARAVGWKAMARNLSDIAAMGGLPRWAVVSLGLRPDTPARYVEQLYRGMQAVAGRFDCQIVGGDTAQVRAANFVVVTLLGEVERSRLVLRSGAQPGDLVLVTGRLGGSLAGRHLRFMPRVQEARWLTEHFKPTAMMDLSDGLASDLQRLAAASQVGFDLEASRIPCQRGCELPAALADGEDFELLLTVRPRMVGRLQQAWPYRLPLSVIGRVNARRGIRLDDQPLRAKGYEHFARG